MSLEGCPHGPYLGVPCEICNAEKIDADRRIADFKVKVNSLMEERHRLKAAPSSVTEPYEQHLLERLRTPELVADYLEAALDADLIAGSTDDELAALRLMVADAVKALRQNPSSAGEIERRLEKEIAQLRWALEWIGNGASPDPQKYAKAALEQVLHEVRY